MRGKYRKWEEHRSSYKETSEGIALNFLASFIEIVSYLGNGVRVRFFGVERLVGVIAESGRVGQHPNRVHGHQHRGQVGVRLGRARRDVHFDAAPPLGVAAPAAAASLRGRPPAHAALVDGRRGEKEGG